MNETIQKVREALVANGFDTSTLAIADEFMPEAGGRDKAALQIAILDAAAAALAALDAETEVKARGCATEGCGKPAIYHFIRGDVGSHYCRDCYMRVQALVTPEARS